MVASDGVEVSAGVAVSDWDARLGGAGFELIPSDERDTGIPAALGTGSLRVVVGAVCVDSHVVLLVVHSFVVPLSYHRSGSSPKAG